VDYHVTNLLAMPLKNVFKFQNMMISIPFSKKYMINQTQDFYRWWKANLEIT